MPLGWLAQVEGRAWHSPYGRIWGYRGHMATRRSLTCPLAQCSAEVEKLALPGSFSRTKVKVPSYAAGERFSRCRSLAGIIARLARACAAEA